MPLAEQASKDGIKMMYQNVPVPEVARSVRRRLCRRPAGAAGPRARRGGGRTLRPQGRRHGDRDRPLRQVEPRRARARHRRRRSKKPGVNGRRRSTRRRRWAADPNLAIPVITAAILANPGRQADRLSGRPAARQRADLHAGGRQEAGRDLQLRLRHQPADRRGLQGRLGAADLRPAAVPAGLPADPQPLPAGRLRPRRR